MNSEETWQSIGFLKLGSGPIELDYEKLELVQQNYGVDVLFAKPLVVRESVTLDGYVTIDSLKEAAGMLTMLVANWLEHNRIPGEIVLHYEMVMLRYDVKVVCKAYEYTA